MTGYFDRVIYEHVNPLSDAERGFAEDGSINPTTLDLTYSEFVSFYTWVKTDKKWKRRKRNFETISKIYTIMENTDLLQKYTQLTMN